MAQLGTSDHLDLGDKMIDRDHREIFEFICDIQDLIRSGRRPDLTATLLRRLERRCRIHFALEEGMMMSTRYPGSTHHLLDHLSMMEQVQMLVSAFDRGDLTRTRTAMEDVTECHLRHIGDGDLRYQLWLDLPSAAKPGMGC